MKLILAASALLGTFIPTLAPQSEPTKTASQKSVALLFYETSEGFRQREGKDSTAYWTQWGNYIEEIRTQFGLESGSGLLPATGPATVDKAGWKPLSSKLQLSGYVVIRVSDLAVARELAAKSPAIANGGKVEVRELLVMTEVAK